MSPTVLGLSFSPSPLTPCFCRAAREGTYATAPWPSEENIHWRMWHREMGGLHLPASEDPRCIVSLQVRFQLDETTDKTHTFSTVPESVEAKRRLPYLPRGEHGYAQITERFIVDMWRSKSLFLLSSPAAKDAAAHADSHIDEGVDLLCQPGDVVILNNSNIRKIEW